MQPKLLYDQQVIDFKVKETRFFLAVPVFTLMCGENWSVNSLEL